MKNLLLSEKWRPKKLEEAILLPRVRKIFENGLNQNVILYGGFGTGKTTLARILIGKYSKDKPFIEINSSFYTSIDTLRNKIDDFCNKVYIGLDSLIDIPQDSIKYVFLDEFDRTSIQYQDALKAYIEEFSKKNVRFILTTNHINKISPGIRSRLVEVDFDCQNSEEKKYLKTQVYKKIFDIISPSEGFAIDKTTLVSIINKKFPDFRSIMIEVDQFRLTGQENTSSTKNFYDTDLFELILKQKTNFEEIYTFINDSFGSENIDSLLNSFGKPFINYLLNDKKRNVESLFKLTSIVCEHQKLLESSTDPIIVGMSAVGKIREILAE